MLNDPLCISSCIDCSYHRILPDPDPHDWFCDDDVNVVCIQTKQEITVACRPYNIRKETSIPSWCPIPLLVETKLLTDKNKKDDTH